MVKRRPSKRTRKTHHKTRPIHPDMLVPVYSPGGETIGQYNHRLSNYHRQLNRSRERFYRFQTTPAWEGLARACAGAHLAFVETSRGARKHHT